MAREYAFKGNATLALSGASQVLVAKNLNRAKIIITSPAAAVSLALAAPPATPSGAEVAPTAVASQGITLPPNSIFTLEGFTGAIAIIGTAAQVLSFVEI
jgi:hypothetical protein